MSNEQDVIMLISKWRLLEFEVENRNVEWTAHERSCRRTAWKKRKPETRRSEPKIHQIETEIEIALPKSDEFMHM